MERMTRTVERMYLYVFGVGSNRDVIATVTIPIPPSHKMIARRANGEFGVCFEVLIVGLFFMALLSCGNVLVCGL